MSFDNGLDAHQQAVLDYKYEQLMKEAKKKDPKLHAQMMKEIDLINNKNYSNDGCLLYTSPSPRDRG